MTLVLECIAVGAAALSAAAAWVARRDSKRNADAAKQSADAASRTANIMAEQLRAEREKRYDPLAERMHVWKFRSYADLAGAIVRLLAAYKTQNRELAQTAAKEFADAEGRLVLLVDSSVCERARAFGHLRPFSDLLHGDSIQRCTEDDYRSLEQAGLDYIKAMAQVLQAGRQDYDAGLTEKYVQLAIENQQPVRPNMTEEHHA